MNRIYKLSVAEGVFFPAFDKHICDDSQITIDNGKVTRQWDGLSFSGRNHFTLHWNGAVELGSYDSFLCFLSAAPHARGTGRAVVDGREVMLFTDAEGGPACVEWKGALPKDGKLLTDVYLEFTFQAERNAVHISWLGLSDSVKEPLIEENVPVWKAEWDEQIHKGAAGRIHNNLLISEQEGESLREMILQDSSLSERIRANAEKGMVLKAEEQLREYVAQGTHMYRFVRVRDRGRESLDGIVLDLAVAGWLFEEAGYSTQAARLILALIAMKWFEGPVCEMEGSRFHHVCFTEDHLSTQVSLAMGFLGGVFREDAEERIIEKVKEAWLFVSSKCKEPGYRNFMNQGVVGCKAMMLGAAFLQTWKGGYEVAVQEAYDTHTAIVNNYLTESGHCAEGPHYYEYSFADSIMLWHTYARMNGKHIKEVVPERVKASGRYLAATMTETDRCGTSITLNCGKEAPLSLMLLTFMTLAGDFPEGNNYLLARLAGSDSGQGNSNINLLFYQLYKAQIAPHPYNRPTEEAIEFPEEGLLTYRKGSTALFVTAERNPLTGHFHEDRGGIILEADGEKLLFDLGTTDYSNPVCALMDKKEYHNLACPPDLTMLAESEVGQKAAAMAAYPIEEELTLEDMAMPEAKVLYHEINGDGYAFAVDTGMLFGENISGVRKGCLSDRRLELEDHWTFPEEHPLMVTFLSYEPWEIAKDGLSATSGRKTLRVKAEGNWQLCIEKGMVDYQSTPVYIMRIMSEAATEHEIHSTLTWEAAEMSPENSGRENTLAFQKLLDQGGTIRIEKPGVYEIEDTLFISSHTRLIFGPGVYLKRSESSIGSFAMINRGAFTRTYDEDIMIEGLHLITNGVEARYHAAVYGLTGELSFFYVKNLRIIDFECLDLPKLSFGIHVCTFEDLVIDRIHVEGRKDAVHLGTGSKFVIRHGLFRTFDDPIALNAHDYAVANPQMGWIEDGLIEDCYDMADKDTTGYFCRILAGSWVDWFEGMQIQNSDTVVHNGRVYRAFQQPDGTFYTSMTPPTHAEGKVTLDGINWVMVQEEVTYQCGCRNIHFKDIHLQKERQYALSIHFDHDRYSRSVYPGSEMPLQQNLIFENIVIQNKVDCLVRSITPVDCIKVLNSVVGDSDILLEALPEEDVTYPKTQVLLMGNTLTADGDTSLIRCEEKCSCEVKAVGNLVMGKDFRAVVEGDAKVTTDDFAVVEK